MKTLKLNSCLNNLIDVCITYNETTSDRNFNIGEIKSLLEYKNKIDEVSSQKLWDSTKKLTNDYELIHLPNRKYKSNSIAKYEPLSRSYFKLWEIIVDFELFKNLKDKIVVAGIAEGPGGFIEAINNYRSKYFNISDDIYGITLRSQNKDVPGWKKAANYLKRNSNISICYGEDDTGNIYNLNNIIFFNNYIRKNNPEGVDIITADGGFDFSIDFNNQEKLSQKLIYCEIVTALTIQKKGGKFICKVFDLYTELSISFIYLLSCFYKNIYINKPLTSRPANSEKYIIAEDFIGISDNYLKDLQNLIKKWNIIDNCNWNVISIFEKSLPIDFVNNILEYNTQNCNIQIENIKKTLNFIQLNKKIDDTKKNQTKLALQWCNKYKVEVNFNSKFILL